MSVTYAWSIPSMKRVLSDGGVIAVRWQASAENGSATVWSRGAISLDYDASGADFIPYEQLTESQVLGWVWKALDKESVEKQLAQLLIENSAETADAVPWASEP